MQPVRKFDADLPSAGLGPRIPLRLRLGCLAAGITRVSNLTGLDYVGIPVWAAVIPNARSLAVAQGKGATHDAAMLSAVMEGIERFHGERTTIPVRVGSFFELGLVHKIANPKLFPHWSRTDLDPHQPIAWAVAWSLAGRRSTLVPYELVNCNFTVPAIAASGSFIRSTTGLAAGRTVIAAQINAICEVIERDAVFRFRRLSRSDRLRRQLELASVTDQTARRLIDLFHTARLNCAVWDATAHTKVPTFVCQVVESRENTRPEIGAMHGAGCHPDPGVALRSSLLEAAQSRVTWIAGTRDDIDAASFVPPIPMPSRSVGARKFNSVPRCRTRSATSRLAWILDRLKRAGYPEVVVADLTDPRLEIPVVRALVPGLAVDHPLWRRDSERRRRPSRVRP